MRGLGFCAIGVLCLTPFRMAQAIAPEVRDGAKLFSQEAVERANDGVRDIMRRSQRDLLIESFPTVPVTPGREKVKGMTADERKNFFATWARARVQASVANGIYVLICKDPPYVEVFITPETQPQFDSKNREQLVQILRNTFSQKKFDQGLEEAVQFVRERLARPAPK